ncbi:hypothetical protein GCM10012284_26750 [Mangrovihabitans endophyticus]|uniref:Uncharacterized protein n=2 Tax=Mangrovihabitans endophyticus TaxID=1751298 RepID=A0A8J3FNZ1_9ACTN|nr:hypothetical protein GCM10012284_26750 [Mangrovihabitans endophyticus]
MWPDRMRGARISARDRFFAAVEVTRIIGPLRTPDADAVRAALAGLHADRPGARVVSRLDLAGGRWRPVPAADAPAWVRNLVIDAGPDADADTTLARLRAEPLGQRPLLFGVGGAYAGLRFNHALGDGRFPAPLMLGVLSAAAAGEPARYPYPSATRLPLLRALGHHLGRRPGRLRAAAGLDRPPSPPATGDELPWRPAIAHHWARSQPGAASRLRAWRDRHAPAASIGAVLSAAVTVAFRAHVGPGDRPGVMVLVDSRRYLPDGVSVNGNFVSGQYVAPPDPSDPCAVHEAMSESLRSGRSLTALALHNARLALTGAPRPPDTVPREPGPHLTLTYVGRADRYANLPWLAGHPQRRLINVVSTAGPQGVTVAVEEFGDVLHATTTFHENVFDPAAMAAATDALVHHAPDLLAHVNPQS